MPVTRDIFLTPKFFPRLTAGDLKRYLDGLPDSAPIEFQIDTTTPVGFEILPTGTDLRVIARGPVTPDENQMHFDFPEDSNVST